METKENIASNSTLELGLLYKAGIYFAEVIQGLQWQHLKLIKTST